MTLHWWMHWFWITLHLILCYSLLVQSKAIDDLRVAKAIDGTSNIPPNTHNTSTGNITNISVTPMFGSNNITNRVSITNITANNLTTEITVIEPSTDDFNETTGLPGSTEVNSMNSTTVIFDNENSLNDTILNVEERIETLEDIESQHNFSAASITGISLGVVAFVGLVVTVSVVIYRNRSFNRPQVLNDRCSNPDSSGYIDDSTIRENSEEMYSLDNDSFLNSLEAMTIQNYWTDTVKHTKL